MVFNGVVLAVVVLVPLGIFVVPRLLKTHPPEYWMGYDYSKRELLLKRLTPFDVCALAPTNTERGMGMRQAMDDLIRTGKIADNRIYGA